MTNRMGRCFKVLLGGEETANGRLFDLSSYQDESLFMQWEAFGHEKTGIYLNDYYLEPENVRTDNDGRKYFFDQRAGGRSVTGWCEFVGGKGFGHITLGEAGYVLRLEPWAPRYDVRVVPGEAAGAYYSDGRRELTWNSASDKWKQAPWGNSQLVFGYEVKSERDPVDDEDVRFAQVLFEDVVTGNRWELNRGDTFQAVMSGSNLMSFEAEESPDQPDRTNNPVRTVFPMRASFQFDRFAFSFEGAYVDSSGNVYAVRGEAHDELAGAYELEDGTRLSLYGGRIFRDGVQPVSAFLQGNRLAWEPRAQPAVRPGGAAAAGFLEFSADYSQIVGGGAKGRRVQGTLAAPRTMPMPMGADASELNVTGLMAMNPMARDADGGWYDTVGRASMQDFYRILLNYMDPTMRGNFISGAPPEMMPEVRHIAYDGADAAAFYRELQTPYLAKALSLTTQDSAKLINGQRASGRLRRGCADSEVYRRHADKLYRLHWLKKFPAMTEYLRDQAEVNRDDKIDRIFKALRDRIEPRIKAMPEEDGQVRWKAVLEELKGLSAWTRRAKVYWAAALYYHLVSYWLPALEMKMKDGHLSQDVAQDIKNLSSLFSLLEGTGTNPDGQTFQMAFIDTIRAFQIGSVIPQYVDYGGDPEYFVQVLESVFSEFVSKHASSADPEIQERVKAMRELAQNRQMTLQFVSMMQTTVRVLGPSATWAKIVNTFQMECESLKTITNALMKSQVIAVGMGIAGFAMVMSMGDFNTLNAREKAQFIGLAASTFASVLFTIARGIVRVAALWKDFQGTWMGIKVFFGADVFAEGQMITVSSRLSSGFAKWFARSREEGMLLQQTGDIGKMGRMFGRNMGEFTAQVFGAAMAIVTIVWSSIELSQATDPLDIAMNSLMIAAASLQLIAIVGGWVLGASAAVSASAAAMMSLCGALSVAAAIAGVVILIIIMTRKQELPDPIRDFANGDAAREGLKMEHGIEIDYFDIVPSKDGASYDGIAFGNAGKYLKVSLSSPPVLGELTYQPETLFFINTDDQGVSSVFTRLVRNDRPVTVFLTASIGGGIVVAPAPEPPARNETGELNPDTVRRYQDEIKRQRWICSCRGDAVTYRPSSAGAERTLMAANFTVENKFYTGKYLGGSGSGVILGTAATTWRLSMEQIGPGQLSYVPSPFTIAEGSHTQTAIPLFFHCGSAPRTWQISPPLPPEFELVREGTAEGTIRQRQGVAAKVYPARPHRVQVSNTIHGQTYKIACDITIEVLPKPKFSVAYLRAAYA